MPLTRGTRLGPYAIESPIGAGGMGEVYKATDTRLERTVAIKVSDSRHGRWPRLLLYEMASGKAARAKVMAYGTGRLGDEQNFVRSAAFGCISGHPRQVKWKSRTNVSSRADKTENSV